MGGRLTWKEQNMKRLLLALPLLAGALYVSVHSTGALADGGQAVSGTISPAPAATTASGSAATATTAPLGNSGAAPQTVNLGAVKVEGERLNRARDTLNVETGSSSYHFDTQSIAALPQGYNAPLQDVMLQAPGVAQDSFGQLHVRGDHADIQYRINGIIIPEFISGFGDALGTRFINKIDFLTGALPAQYGYRTAGMMNITTNDGLETNGGSVDLYGGSHGTIEPSMEYGGTQGKLDYYFTGTYLQSDLGIESPTSSTSPLHDDTEQNRAFGYVSYLLNDDMRLGAILGHSLGNFQIPNNPGLSRRTSYKESADYPSADLNETQRELNDYGIVALQGIKDQLNYSVALFSRYSAPISTRTPSAT